MSYKQTSHSTTFNNDSTNDSWAKQKHRDDTSLAKIRQINQTWDIVCNLISKKL